MTRRQAKKRVQKKWRIPRGSYPSGAPPRLVDALLQSIDDLAKSLSLLFSQARVSASPDGALQLVLPPAPAAASDTGETARASRGEIFWEFE